MDVPEVIDERLRPLAWTRIALAIIVLLRTTPVLGWFDAGLADATPLLGWPHGGFQVAAFGATLPIGVVKVLCVVRTVGAVGFLLGWFTLPAGLVTGVAGYAVFLQDAYSFTFTQHLLFLGTAVLALTDCATVLAVRPDRPRAPDSSRWLVQVFLVAIYFWAAFVKLRRDWIDGRTLGLFFDEGRLSGPLARALMGTTERRAIAAPAVVATELSLVVLLLWPRTRWLGIAIAVVMHASIEWMAHPDVIGWAMCAFLLSFVPVAQGTQRASSTGQT